MYMDSLRLLLGFVGILREALKIFHKNGRIMASIALLTLLTKSILYLSNTFSIKPIIADLMLERKLLHVATSGTQQFTNVLTHIRNDIKIIYGLEVFFFIVDVVANLLSTTATILAAAIIHGGIKHDYSLKDLLLKTTRSWSKPLVTWLYTTLLGLVYLCGLLGVLFGISVMIKSQVFSPFVVVFLGFASLFIAVSGIGFFVYLSAMWTLALVVSAVEEIRGTEAVSKAEQLLKSMVPQGILLHLFFIIPIGVLMHGINIIPKASLVAHIIVALVVVNSAGLLRMYWFAAFTVFYYRCKKTHGERVELKEESLDGYTKVPTTANTTTSTAPLAAVSDIIP